MKFIQQAFSSSEVHFPCSFAREINMRISTTLAIMMAFVSSDISAAYFRDGGFLADQGILESIRIEPRLPAAGESFTVKLVGSWPAIIPGGICRPPLDFSEVVVYPGSVVIISVPQQDSNYCDQPPASWSINVTIPASAWDAVNDEGYLVIEHQLFSGINMLTGIDQVFDMRLGTHEVPAFIGSGFWISPDLPYEGILIEQQGSRMLFYGLGYDRDVIYNDDDGEPVWQLVAGEMYGDSTLGRSYRFDWPFDENNMPLEKPTEMELITNNDSGAIIVDDFNHLKVFTEVTGNRGLYRTYNRLFFGLDKSRLPNYVPPLEGRWTLYGFDGQNTGFTSLLELKQGSSESSNQYHFASTDDDWMARCTIVPPGTGDCTIERASDGAKFEFPMTAFQGNLARGNLVTGENNAIDGVLVRDPWRLPVLNGQ